MGTASTGFWFFREHGWGTWDRLHIAPIRPFEIVAGKAIPMLALYVCQQLILVALGGAIAQLTTLPGWVQAIAPASPVYWTIDDYRSVLVGEQGFSPAVAMQLGFAILFTAVTLWAFRADKPKESYAGE